MDLLRDKRKKKKGKPEKTKKMAEGKERNNLIFSFN